MACSWDTILEDINNNCPDLSSVPDSSLLRFIAAQLCAQANPDPGSVIAQSDNFDTTTNSTILEGFISAHIVVVSGSADIDGLTYTAPAEVPLDPLGQNSEGQVILYPEYQITNVTGTVRVNVQR